MKRNQCVWFLFILFWRIPLKKKPVSFFLTVCCDRSFDTVPCYCHYIWLGIIGDGLIPILSVCWLPIVFIYRLTIFHFWPIILIISPPSPPPIFLLLIESNHRLMIFVLPKTIIIIYVFFLQLIDCWYQSNWWFFHHQCPPMAINTHLNMEV